MGNESGKIGEDLAKDYLKKKGYKIVKQNFRIFEGEIDIIAFDKSNDELVFVEVKTRKTDNFGMPEEFVDYRKIEKIKKAAFSYLAANPFSDWRIDVVAIIYDKDKNIIEHIENITL